VVVSLVFNHFRGHVLQSAAKGVALLVEFLLDTPSEIANLQYVLFTHQEVFRLEISVDKAVFVEKVDSSDSLNKKVECFVLCQQTLLVSISNDVEKVSLLHIL